MNATTSRKVMAGITALVVVVGVISAVLAWKALTSSISESTEQMWLDETGDVTVVRNPSIASNAALYSGSFSVGQDDCLTIAVDGETTYIAALDPSAAATQDAVSDRGISYDMGATAWFSKTELRGPLPSELRSKCPGSLEVFGISLVKPPNP